MSKARDLSKSEIDHLSSRRAEYRRSNAAEKAVIRQECVKHIMELQKIAANEYAEDLFSQASLPPILQV